MFDIAAFITRSASAQNVDRLPEESEPENPSEIFKHENCVTFRPRSYKFLGVIKGVFVGCCAERWPFWDVQQPCFTLVFMSSLQHLWYFKQFILRFVILCACYILVILTIDHSFHVEY